jgi:DNA-binding transcriptional LysR family regulator
MYRWEFKQEGQQITVDVPGQITLDEAGLMLEAALKGMGLAYLSEWWIGDSVREGKLIRVLDDFTPSSAGLCLLPESPISTSGPASPHFIHRSAPAPRTDRNENVGA